MRNIGIAQPAETRHDDPRNAFVRAHAMQYDLDQVGGVGQVYWAVEREIGPGRRRDRP